MDTKTVDANHSALTEKVQTKIKSPKFKVGDRARITKYKNVFSQDYTKNWSKEMLSIDSVLKLILGRIILKI